MVNSIFNRYRMEDWLDKQHRQTEDDTRHERGITRRKVWKQMRANLRSLAVAGGVLAGVWAVEPALAQKPGGVLRMPMGTSPASMSI